VRDLEFLRQHDYQSTEQRLRSFDAYQPAETIIYDLLYERDGRNWRLPAYRADSSVISRKLSGGYEPNTISHFFQKKDQRQKSLREMVRRFGMAMLGGVALIVPMLIMTLHKSRNTCIITVSVATFVFAAFVAVFSRAQEQEVLGVVAAYAAVLVVFVGTSGP
jgi:VIT1/CCC1 family predicted Fe2+/Mn2+ transporter